LTSLTAGVFKYTRSRVQISGLKRNSRRRYDGRSGYDCGGRGILLPFARFGATSAAIKRLSGVLRAYRTRITRSGRAGFSICNRSMYVDYDGSTCYVLRARRVRGGARGGGTGDIFAFIYPAGNKTRDFTAII